MDWTGFRGTNRDGVVHGVTIRQDWSTNPPREVWRHPIGRAWSSFAIVGEFAFTQEQRERFECVVAYNFETGKQVWVHQDQALLSIVDANGGPGPHATPQFHEGMIYSVGGTGILNCLNASTGQRIWSTNILQLKPGHSDASETDLKPPQWGVSHSPLIVDDLVIVIPGGTLADHRGVAAYQKKTGDLVWSAGEHPASYGSPSVGTLQDTRQILVPNGNGLSGHAIDDGRELWFYRLENDPKVNSASPIVLDNQSLVFGTGYGVGTVRLDVTKSDNQWSASKKWMTNRFRPKFNDFVLCDGFLYGLDDGTLCCVDLKNGALKWKSGRYGYGQVLLFDNQLLIISEDGELLLIPATSSKPEPIASKKILDSGFCWNHIAYSRGKVLIRNANEVVCLEIAESQ